MSTRYNWSDEQKGEKRELKADYQKEKFIWTDEYQQEFEHLKACLTSVLVFG